MSSILDLITSRLDDKAVGQLGGQLGAQSDQLNGAISAALPMILGQLTRNANSGTGAEDLRGTLDRHHDGSVLNDVGGYFDQRPTASDTRMVDNIFGPKRQAAERAIEQASGLSPQATGGLMENLAPLIMGALGQQSKSGGFDAGQLTKMLGGETDELRRREPAAMGSLDQLLDSDSDGQIDISSLAQQGAKILGSFFRR